MPDPTTESRLSILTIVVVLVVTGIVSFVQAQKQSFDFHHFYRDGRYVWEHAALNPDPELPFYLPVVALLIAPLTMGGVLPAAAAWALGQVVALALSIRALHAWAFPRDARSPPSTAIVAAATVSAIPVIYVAARFNQLSFLILALVVFALASIERRRPVRAGILFGLAIVLKLVPTLFVVWLLLKRQWAALATLVATVVVIALLPGLIAFGPMKTMEYHRQWWSFNVQGAPLRGMVPASTPARAPLREHFVDHRNQSIAAVVSRLFWPDHPYAVPVPLASLDKETCRAVATAISLLLGAALLWATRRRFSSLSALSRRAELSCYLLAMPVLSPLFRQYYLVWALPALVLLVGLWAKSNSAAARACARAAIVVWILGMAAWLSQTARAYGVHLLMFIALAVLLLCAARASRVEGRSQIRARSP